MDKEVIINNQHIVVTKETVKFPSGAIVDDYYLVRKDDYAAVVLFEKRGDEHWILLVNQFRPGAKQCLWNLPMGGLAANETPIEAARRELLEETGYVGELEEVGRIMPAPGFFTSTCHVFVAKDARLVQQQHDDEIVKTEYFSWEQIRNDISNGGIIDMTTVASLLLVQQKGLLR